jgi:hypothetical protein
MYQRIYEKLSFLTRWRGQNGKTLRHSHGMNGYAGLCPSRKRRPEDSTLSGYAPNSRRECADLVAGPAVLTAEVAVAGTDVRYGVLLESHDFISRRGMGLRARSYWSCDAVDVARFGFFYSSALFGGATMRLNLSSPRIQCGGQFSTKSNKSTGGDMRDLTRKLGGAVCCFAIAPHRTAAA